MTLTRFASALIGASALVFSVSASAEPKAHHDARDTRAAESAFPMKTEAFKKLVDSRVDRLKSHLEASLSHRSLTPEQKSEIGKAMDGAVGELHAAVDKVGADGLVTAEEAKKIKAASEQLRSKMRAELRGKHASSAKSAKAGGQKHGSRAASKVKALAKKSPKTAKDAIVLPADKAAKKADKADKASEK